jgi:hypothetical protein
LIALKGKNESLAAAAVQQLFDLAAVSAGAVDDVRALTARMNCFLTDAVTSSSK